jgi:hypothetical protein
MATGRIEQDVVIKVSGQEDLAAAEKAIEEIDGTTATASVEVDSAGVSDGVSEVDQKLSEIDGTTAEATVDVRIGDALTALDQMAAEAQKSQLAVEALSNALGPELTARMDVERAVSDFQRMNLTLDEITANADQLGAKLREVDQLDIGGGIAAGAGRARTATDDLGRSADSSKNALANMVGNSVQDLGQLGGVAGSAGVAIGQMAEFMSDAALEGEGLGSVIGNFATVAGPIAALSIGIGLVTSAITSIQEKNKKIAEDSKAISEGIAQTFTAIDLSDVGTASDLLAQISANFIDTQDTAGRTLLALQELGIGFENLGATLAALDQGTAGRTQFFENFLATSDRVTGANAEVSKSIADLIVNSESYDAIIDSLDARLQFLTGTELESAKAALEFAEANKDVITQLEQVDDASEAISIDQVVKDNTDALLKAKGGVEAYIRALQELGPEASKFDLLKRSIEILNDATLDLAGNAAAWAKANKPMEDMPKQWDAAADAAERLRSGQQPTIEQTKTITQLMDAYGLTEQQVLDKGIQLWDDHQAAQQKATDDAIQSLKDWAAEMEKTQIAIGEFGQTIADMTGFFPTAERALDAIGKAFDLENAPLDQAEQIVAFNDQLRDLTKFTKDLDKVDLAAVFKLDPNNINTADFIDKIKGLRGAVQTEISEAFAQAGGGEAGALAGAQTAQAFITQIFEALHGALPKEKIAELLGIGDLNLIFKVAIDQQSLAEATAILDAFVAIPGVDPLLAFQLRVGLASGTLKPADVLTIMNDQLKNMGAAELPSKLMPPEGKSMSDARTAADDFYKLPGNNAFIPTKTGAPSNVNQTLTDTQGVLDKTWVVIPTKLGPPSNAPTNGTPSGTIGRGPRRMIFARRGGAAVPVGAVAATNGATVAPAATVQPMLVSPTINISAGVIGNRYDVMRTVQKANHDLVRLLGNR